MLRYRIMKGRNLKQDIMIKNISRVDFSLPLITGLSRSFHSLAMTKVAFTLAEVLITLGIIGIVAAMTMPALIEGFQKQSALNKLKQTYSIIIQGMSAASYDFDGLGMQHWTCPNYEYGDYGMTRCFGLTFDKVAVAERYPKATGPDDIMCKNPGKSYPGYPGTCANSYSVRLKNGACITYNYLYWCGGDGGKVLIDIDGPDAGPNKLGRDIFVFLYGRGNDQRQPIIGAGKRIEPYGASSDEAPEISRSDLLRNCQRGKDNCARLIIKDGWQIKKDYPW